MARPLFDRVAIVGVGLIGGSVGMALKRRRLAAFVTGVVRRKSTIAEAFAKGALDAATLDLKKGVKDADLVVLCAPVFDIERHIRAIAPHVKKGALVIDVGSTKASILAAAKKSLKRARFVGCHPMAGSEKCGIDHAEAGLFDGAVCFLTSRDARAEKLWRALGARPVTVGAAAHDAWVARMSHLPHVFSFALFQGVRRLPGGRFPLNPSAAQLARLARSSPRLWSEILVSNRAPMRRAIAEFSKVLRAFDRALAKRDTAALRRLVDAANRAASQFPE